MIHKYKKSEKNKIEEGRKSTNSPVHKENSEPLISGQQRLIDGSNIQDFPELKAGSSNPYNMYPRKDLGMRSQKSWLSVVQSSFGENKFNKSFPYLPGVKNEIEIKKSLDVVNKNLNDDSLQKDADTTTKEPEEIKTLDSSMRNKKNKKISKSSSGIVRSRNPNKKKRSDPIFLNFNDILKANPVKKKKEKSNFQRHTNKESFSGNILDSSNPIRYKGKHREIKKKKLTNLKFAIIKERIIKQKMREAAKSEYCGNELNSLIESLDFKLEIKNYLKELEKRKSCKLQKKPQENLNLENECNSNLKKVQDVTITENFIEENSKGNYQETSKSLKVEKKFVEVESEEKETLNLNTDLEKKNVAQEDNVVTSLRKTQNSELDLKVKFSSKFREYCDNLITPSLNLEVSELIKQIVNLQDKMFARDPMKAKSRKRHISGFKEVKKYLIVKKVKMIIIAPDLEKSTMQGSIYDSIDEIKSSANSQNVPYVFALNRHKLGICTKKKVPISVFGILNYAGTENQFDKVCELLKDAKEKFARVSPNTESKIESEDVNAKVISSFILALNENLKLSNDTECDTN